MPKIGLDLKSRLVVYFRKYDPKYEAKVDEAVLKMDESVVGFPLNLTDADVKIVKAEELFVR